MKHLIIAPLAILAMSAHAGNAKNCPTTTPNDPATVSGQQSQTQGQGQSQNASSNQGQGQTQNATGGKIQCFTFFAYCS